MKSAQLTRAVVERSRLAVLLCVVAMSLAVAVVDADEMVAGRVEQGETGYEIPVEITNRSSEIARGLTVVVSSQPAGLIRFTVDPPAVGSLEPGETQTIVVGFDVAVDGPTQARAEIHLDVNAVDGVVDNSSPILIVGIGMDPSEGPETGVEPEAAPDVEVGVEADSGVPEATPPVLRLVSIDRRGEARESASLGTEQQRKGFFSEAEFDEILSVGFTTAPAEIIAGQPVSFEVSVMRSVRYADGSFCYRSEPEVDSNSVGCSLRIGGLKAEGRGDVGMSNYCGGNLKSSAEWHTGSRATSYENVFTDETSFTVTLSPAGEERVERGGERVEVHYQYSVEIGGTGTLVEEPSLSEIVLVRQWHGSDGQGRTSSTETTTGSSLNVALFAPSMATSGGIGLTLVYQPVQADGPTPLDPIPFEHPEPFAPTPGRTSSGSVDEAPGAGDGDESGVGVGASNGRESDGVDPTDPGIARLIAEWIRVAEPPENATIGADLRYTAWGQMVGSTPSGTITATDRPDDIGARTSSEYLWALRNRLDSVDHCTLGEFVEGRLAGSDPIGCSGRYMGEVNDFGGRSETAARRQVEQLRWVAITMRGDPAPAAEFAGMVQRQDPAPGTRLPRGQVVRLWIYDEIERRQVEVPDLVGQSSRMAGAWLDDLGLVAVVQRGGPAPSDDLVGRVEAQEPMPGAGLTEGEAVVVRVYADSVDAPSSSALDCSRWPGSVPTAHPTGGNTICDCPDGFRWDSSGTSCTAGGDTDQAICDRDWPGTVARRSASTGQLECTCQPGLAWSQRERRCSAATTVAVAPILPDHPGGCGHMPGTIATKDPRSGRTDCRCPVGTWDAGQRRCVTAALAPLEPRVCVGHYADIRLAGVAGDAAAVTRAEAAARAAGCSPDHIGEAVSSGDAWGSVSRTVTGRGASDRGNDDSPVTPITEPAADKHEGEARVSSRAVRICIVDVNAVLDDHYHLLVNHRYIGDVANPEGGSSCFNATLQSGSNRLELRLYATRGKNTKLEMSLNGGEYSAVFTGENNHIWNVTAP